LLSRFATTEIFKLASDIIGVETPESFDLDKIEQVFSDIEEGKDDYSDLLNHFLEKIYGNESKLESGPWLKKVAKEIDWIWSAPKLRKEVFRVAGV
jgi:hypothetical protein